MNSLTQKGKGQIYTHTFISFRPSISAETGREKKGKFGRLRRHYILQARTHTHTHTPKSVLDIYTHIHAGSEPLWEASRARWRCATTHTHTHANKGSRKQPSAVLLQKRKQQQLSGKKIRQQVQKRECASGRRPRNEREPTRTHIHSRTKKRSIHTEFYELRTVRTKKLWQENDPRTLWKISKATYLCCAGYTRKAVC